MDFDKTRGSVLMTIRSRDLLNPNSNNSSGRLQLFENIVAEDDEVLGLKLVSGIFPNSWYNLSANIGNNILEFKETGDTGWIAMKIDDGSYNITEFTELIKSLLDDNSTNNLTYTITYDKITNTLNIKNSNPTEFNTIFNFEGNASCRRFLGFTTNNKTINSSSGITSDRCIDITDTFNSLYVRLPNVSNQKIIESSTSKYSNIIAHIPVPFSRNAIFVYEPNHPFIMELTQKQINSIEIAITFQNERMSVDFNKGDWEINLELSFHRKKHKRKNGFMLNDKMRRKIEDFNKNQKNAKMAIGKLKNMVDKK